MDANTKDLIERLRTEKRDSVFPELCAEAADALERLTQPVGVDLQRFAAAVPIGMKEAPDGPFVYHKDYAETVARLQAERDEAKLALSKIDAIRNSIIGAQSVNWSEHVYPLVAVLNAAGFEGQPYETAKANLGTLIEQAKAAEKERDALQEQVKMLRDAAAPYLDPYFEDKKPTTFACHHNTETCPSCEGLVKRWKYQKALREALAATEPKKGEKE